MSVYPSVLASFCQALMQKHCPKPELQGAFSNQLNTAVCNMSSLLLQHDWCTGKKLPMYLRPASAQEPNHVATSRVEKTRLIVHHCVLSIVRPLPSPGVVVIQKCYCLLPVKAECLEWGGVGITVVAFLNLKIPRMVHVCTLQENDHISGRLLISQCST